MRTPEEDTRCQALWTAFIVGLVVLASRVLDPSSASTFTVCTFKNATGLPCAGCGMGHAFEWLVRGRVDMALRANALSPVVFVATLWAGWRAVTVLLGWRQRLWPAAPRGTWIVGLVVVLGWWGVRLWKGI